MKYTNLEMVNKCLEVVNERDVNTITGDENAERVLSIVEDVYYDLVSRMDIPSTTVITTLTATETSAQPTAKPGPLKLRLQLC